MYDPSRRRMLATLGTLGALTMMDAPRTVADLFEAPTTPRMPVLFLGHGNPMNAIVDTPFSNEWKRLGERLPAARAIVCVSAHWETNGTAVTAMARPQTIHDFGGFPDELFAVRYPAPGSPEIAEEVRKQAVATTIALDHQWGLDHGAWSVLKRLVPDASVPVLQLSLDVTKNPQKHIDLARELAPLRDRGVIFLGSGNIVHNLRRMSMTTTHEWAREFDELSVQLIGERDLRALADYPSLGEAARLSIPTNEHYLPMLYALGLSTSADDLQFFNRGLDLGSVSMTSFVAG